MQKKTMEKNNIKIELEFKYDEINMYQFYIYGYNKNGTRYSMLENDIEETLKEFPELSGIAQYYEIWHSDYYEFPQRLINTAKNKIDMFQPIGAPISFCEAFMFNGCEIPMMSEDYLIELTKCNKHIESPELLQIHEVDKDMYMILYDGKKYVKTTLFESIGEAEAVLNKIKTRQFNIVKIVKERNKNVKSDMEYARKVAMRPDATIEELTDPRIAYEIRDEIYAWLDVELRKLGFKTKQSEEK